MIFIFLFLIIVFFSLEAYCSFRKKSLLEVLHPDWFEDVAVFPEHDFPCKVNCEEYDSTVKKGFETMKMKKIVFGGLCVNIRDQVSNLIKRVQHLGSYFQEYKFVVFENDSTDGTRELLSSYSSVILVPCDEDENCKLKEKGSASIHGAYSPTRMKKMADYRNRLLNYITKNFDTYDCLCIFDLDIEGPVDIRGFAHSFGYYNQWDAISAQGLLGTTPTLGYMIYYDTIAYKDEYLDMNTISKSHAPFIIKKASMYKVGDFPYKVKSGFCGLALYKMNSVMHVDYIPKDGKYICEHVILHDNMIDQGYDNIYINPNMLVLVGAQGTPKSY
jgi:hypothetical protein